MKSALLTLALLLCPFSVEAHDTTVVRCDSTGVNWRTPLGGDTIGHREMLRTFYACDTILIPHVHPPRVFDWTGFFECLYRLQKSGPCATMWEPGGERDTWRSLTYGQQKELCDKYGEAALDRVRRRAGWCDTTIWTMQGDTVDTTIYCDHSPPRFTLKEIVCDTVVDGWSVYNDARCDSCIVWYRPGTEPKNIPAGLTYDPGMSSYDTTITCDTIPRVFINER